MDLGVSYTAWTGDDMDLLVANITNMRPVAHHISVVFQEISYSGETIKKRDFLLKLNDLRTSGLIDSIFEHKPKMDKSQYQNDMIKRQVGYDVSKKTNCTHYLSLDVHEFYEIKRLNRAMTTFEKKGYDASVVKSVTYCGDFGHVIGSSEYNAFIYKIDGDRKYKLGSTMSKVISHQPSKQIPSSKVAKFGDSNIVMHSLLYKAGEGVKNTLANRIDREHLTDDVVADLATFYKEWTPDMNKGMYTTKVYRGNNVDSLATVVRPMWTVDNKFSGVCNDK